MIQIFQNLWENSSALHSPLQQLDLNPLDLLKISFHFKSISHDLILQCLHCIHSNYLPTKDSLYCLAELQLYYKNLSANLHLFSSSSSTSSSEDFDDFIHQIYEIGQFCFQIIELDQSEHQQQQSSLSTSQSSVTLILDLFPSLIQILSNLFPSNNMTTRRMLGNNRIVSDSPQRGPQLMLDCFFAVQWSPCYVVFLCNIVTEIWEYLFPRHKAVLKVTLHPTQSPHLSLSLPLCVDHFAV
jgi:hypothetical protein